MQYHIYKDQSGQWRWRFIAANGQILASGEAYHNKQDCLNVIGWLKASKDCPTYEMTS